MTEKGRVPSAKFGGTQQIILGQHPTGAYYREIEEVSPRHPGLAEVSVVGRPHAEWGEEVVAFVVSRPGAEITPEALDRLCLDHIARFKRPREYRFVEALPKNNYGNVLKTELRKLVAHPSR